MKRDIGIFNIQLRDWQQRAFNQVKEYYSSGLNNFLCVATPGGGKTKFALAVAHYGLKNHMWKRIVIVVPTENLKTQWAREAALMGIDIDPEFKNSQGVEAPDYYGCSITYAQIGKDSKPHQANTFQRETFVILDECHHAGDSLSWGDGVRNAFEGAVFRLLLSGTAFRSDDNEIPFVTYKDKISVADFEYTYAQALQDNVCRPIYFPAYDGVMKYKVGSEEFEHSFSDVIDDDLVGKRLKTALDTKGDWLKAVINDAHKKLVEIRNGEHRDAAGLAFAMNQKHAREIAKVVMEITGIRPEIVTSEETDGCYKIDRFKKSNDYWIVCVKMISEGIDIPRLRVGVYATNVKADLFFRQAVGRFVRVLKGLDAQDAFIYVPKDKEIVKLAENIEKERKHALEDCKPTGDAEPAGDLFPDYVPARQGTFIPLSSRALNSTMLRVNVEISQGAKFVKDDRQEESVFERKHRLKENINKLAKVLAIKEAKTSNSTRPEFQKFHKLWISQGGKNIETETLEELEKRYNWLQNQSNKYQQMR